MRAPRRPAMSIFVGHPWLVLGAWVVVAALLVPAALTYTRAINYGGSSPSLDGTPSARAADLLASVAPSRSTLIVAVNTTGATGSILANATQGLEIAVASAHWPYVNGSRSVFGAYAAYLDGVVGPLVPTIRATYVDLENLTGSVYGFPAQFLAAWETAGATRSSVNSTYAAVGGSAVGYEEAFREALLNSSGGGGSAPDQVQVAIETAAPAFFPPGAPLTATLARTNVTGFTSALPALTSAVLASEGIGTVPPAWVPAALGPADFGRAVAYASNLSQIPSFLSSQFVSPDGTLMLVFIEFSVDDSFRTASGAYPAQEATPALRSLAQQYFGDAAVVTGPGAAAYDVQQLDAGAGILFALTFVFLAAAVALTLRSWIAPLLALVLVSVSTLLGYAAIELTGLFVGKVDFTVTYTLTAVTLGVATDYLLFILYRYREELTKGRSPPEALGVATTTSGFAVLVSAVTVAVGLGALSFLGSTRTWGPVLLLTVLAIGVLEVTLVPALIRLIGPRLFLKRWLTAARPPARSVFYRAAARSTARPTLVALLALGIAIPSVAGFFLVPTTYDFAGSLPASAPSTQGQMLVAERFGSNLLYPSYVIVTANASFLDSSGNLSAEGSARLPLVAADLVGRTGVGAVAGPFASGRNLSGPAGATAFVFDAGRLAYFVVYCEHGPYSPEAFDLVEGLRSTPGYLVGGLTSSVLDQRASDQVQFPLLEVLLAVLIGAVLGFAFRSAAVPLISLGGVFLSISATTGLLYLLATFVLHQPLVYLIPLILFVILLSLGNDYTVFLLSRIREEQAVHGPREGIHRGIAGSGVVVSALGLILAASLGSLALQPLVFLEQIGLAFVLSLVLDTFVVRPFFFPAMLSLVHRRPPPGEAGPPAAPRSVGGAPGP